MNPQDTKPGTDPEIPIQPEDSPRLQEIEALEAREVDPHPKPFDPSVLRSKPRVTPKPVVVAASKPTPAPATPPKTPEPVPVPAPVKPAVAPTPVEPKPAPVAPPQPKPAAPKPVVKVKKTPAAEMAEELANAPPTKLYQFFHDQNGLRRPQRIIIAAIAGAIIVIGITLAVLLLK